jgi:inner membrane protein
MRAIAAADAGPDAPAEVTRMPWWFWILGGLILLAFELLTPGGFFILFFGIGAILVGGLAFFDAAGPAWVQWVLFSVLSLLSLALFRGKLLAYVAQGRRQGAPIDELVGQVAQLLEDLPAGGVGKAELRGTAWSCRGTGGSPLRQGQRCIVERVDGLMLWLRPE